MSVFAAQGSTYMNPNHIPGLVNPQQNPQSNIIEHVIDPATEELVPVQTSR